MEPEEAGLEPEGEEYPMAPAEAAARPVEEAPSEAPAGAETAAPPPSRSLGVPEKGRIEHLVTWGNIQMTISDYGAAVRTFTQLVDEAPRVAAHRVRLAIAMALWPATAKRAEREFHEALRLDPNNADAHYQLALYYKNMKLRTRALEQLRITLSLQPNHRRAREELEVISPKDNALRSLTKLFR
jgi:tetratricopeptide (TPR) repeat protein